MSRKIWRSLALSVGLGLGACGSAPAEDVVAVLSSNMAPYREAFQGVQDGLGRSIPSFILADGQPQIPAETRVIVAIGGKAASYRYPGHAVLINCMSPGLQVKQTQRTTVEIHTSPHARSILSKIKELQPAIKRLGILWSSDSMEDYLMDVDGVRKTSGIELHAERLKTPDDLADRLRAWQGKVDAYWVLPDPRLVRPEVFEILRGYTKDHPMPVYAAAETMIDEGAAVALYSSYREIGRRAGRAARDGLSGSLESTSLFPEKVEMAINRPQALAAGLKITPELLKEAARELR